MRLNTARPSQRRAQAAYSLPEAVVAVLILGTMLVSLYAGFTSGFAVVQLARENLRATQIILERMESLRLYTWSQLQDTNNYLKPAFIEYFEPFAQTNQGRGVLYSGSVSVSRPLLPVEATYSNDLIGKRTIESMRTAQAQVLGGDRQRGERRLDRYVAGTLVREHAQLRLAVCLEGPVPVDVVGLDVQQYGALRRERDRVLERPGGHLADDLAQVDHGRRPVRKLAELIRAERRAIGGVAVCGAQLAVELADRMLLGGRHLAVDPAQRQHQRKDARRGRQGQDEPRRRPLGIAEAQ